MWNVSASGHCFQHCDGVIYKADTVIDTVQTNDECKTTETLTCRILPSKVYQDNNLFNLDSIFKIKRLQLCDVNIITSTVALMIHEQESTKRWRSMKVMKTPVHIFSVSLC